MKYIDADKLIKSVNRYQDNAKAAFNPIEDDADYYKGKIDACEDIQEFIISLQQEQPELVKGKFVFPNFLYARTVDNKTIDVSYAPQSMDAVEYIKNDPTEQPGVDLEKEYNTWWNSISGKINVEHIMEWYMHETAHHFYEFGKNAK